MASSKYWRDLKQEEVYHRNRGLDLRLERLQTLLERGLGKTKSLEEVLASLVDLAHIPPHPGQAPTPPNKATFQALEPEPRFLERIIGIGKNKRAAQINDIQIRCRKAFVVYHKEKARYDAQVSARQHALLEREQALAKLSEPLMIGEERAIERYFERVLSLSEYPEGFPQKVRLAYNREARELVLEYDLPTYDDIMPTIKGYKFIKTRDEVQELKLNRTDERRMKSLYADVVSAIALRTLYELFASDEMRALNLVVFNGMVDAIDKATGQDIRPCLVSVQTSREDFEKLDLSRVDKVACLKHLKAQTSPSSSELVPVKPVVHLAMTDSRFIEEVDVLSGIDSRTNLLEMSPSDFEQLIGNLFSQMGFMTGTTTLSRDGGVDVIAFDEHPILGGKVIIQAKRYRNTVGVESVRALYGVMQDEGATKGVLVTTSSFGKASREFVLSKPIVLIDGNGLLHHLAEHGYQAKIEIPDR